MALTFTKQPQGPILNAYNNNIYEFSTSLFTGVRAVILVDDQYRFEITPNQGRFYFNLSPVMRVLINQDAFSDNIAVNPPSFVYPDNRLFKTISVEITVISANASTASDNLTIDYIKGAEQLFPDHYQKNNIIRVLSPSANNIKHLTYFEGYPFDFTILANQSQNATIRNTRTGATITVSLTKGANRIFLSNGENDKLGFENNLPLTLGVNFLQITYGSENIIVAIKKEPVRCGVYLKWLNEEGAWSYWLFEGIYTGKLSHRTNGTVNRDYDNLDETMAREIITGKTAYRELSLNTGVIEEYERKILEQIYSSAKCYMYSNLELQPFTPEDFKAVRVKDTTDEIISTKLNHHKYSVDIQLPNKYTQTYAG